MESFIRFRNDIPDTSGLNEIIDIGIIPWDDSEFARTILPTKLIENLRIGIPTVAPNFPEFRRLIKNGENGYMFNYISEVPRYIKILGQSPELLKQMRENCKFYISNSLDKTSYQSNFINFLKATLPN
jgi:glycosyltransferase involved in cell wall biosynthesis